MDHIKGHYFCSHPTINPHGIVPIGPRWVPDAIETGEYPAQGAPSVQELQEMID